ncbi:hypothetical protein BU26DRAFT_564012 [Trematosphaeria pertusa]|uniref:NmrA-like domain-containing protein n=1 Tax=Trematosphaeria pertusa TaxID=390896 RepID=A0A6A6IJT0_9PLEO|nr:uncharacterized protein BU26DRAFT_564012 [Trematosphaeria pertusa]KAF2250132.1 hypothetical protein BU26DRAFT_564012 [Trematosphaeria pertusa]
MATSNRIGEVAIVGGGGNVGGFVTEALLSTDKHIVTAITRANSQSTWPERITVAKVDYSKPGTLIEARGTPKGLLGLPKGDTDEAIKAGIERSKAAAV